MTLLSRMTFDATMTKAKKNVIEMIVMSNVDKSKILNINKKKITT